MLLCQQRNEYCTSTLLAPLCHSYNGIFQQCSMFELFVLYISPWNAEIQANHVHEYIENTRLLWWRVSMPFIAAIHFCNTMLTIQMYQVVTGDLDRLVVHQVHLFPPPPWSTQQNKQVHFIIIIWYLNSTQDKSDYNGGKNGELDDGPSLSSMYSDKHVATKPIYAVHKLGQSCTHGSTTKWLIVQCSFYKTVYKCSKGRLVRRLSSLSCSHPLLR